jgi:hypothetical protein
LLGWISSIGPGRVVVQIDHLIVGVPPFPSRPALW